MTLQSSLFTLAVLAAGAHAQSNFSWASITPNSTLEWKECLGAPLQCARLEVPLDYSNPDGENKAAIALIRIPATVSTDDAAYRGPVLLNPGGPGGSGVDLVIQEGANFSQWLGPQFDIVSFDPRGVGLSTPGVSFYDSQIERILNAHTPNSVNLNASEDAIGRLLAKSKSTNALAKQRIGDDVLPYINTDYTVKDMVKIVEAHGREKIMFWGMSYGTILATTFASMYPDKIERMVVDGVVDADGYYGANWDFTLDTDRAVQMFCESCHEAGADKCAFYSDSPEEICQNLNNIRYKLHDEPIAVPPDANGVYGVIDYSAFVSHLFALLYRPYPGFQLLAAELAELQAGNATTIMTALTGGVPTTAEAVCTQPSDDEKQFTGAQEVIIAVLCTDSAPNGEIQDNLEQAREHVKKLEQTSSFGEIMGGFRLGCIDWQISPPEELFRGPVGADNTSYPLLFVGNEADPITPHAFAVKMSERFPGSSVLGRNFTGHVSRRAPSQCTTQAIASYFVNGTLPENGTWCPVDYSPFDMVLN